MTGLPWSWKPSPMFKGVLRVEDCSGHELALVGDSKDANAIVKGMELLERIYTEADEQDEGKGGRFSVELMEELRRFVKEMQK